MAVAATELIWEPQLLTARLDAAFAPAVEAATEVMRAAAPRASGKMAAGIKGRVVVPGEVGVVYIPRPGMFVIRGTRPHDISPRKKKVLAFNWNGDAVFFAHVQHPGTHANPFHESGVASFPTLYRKFAAAALLA